MINELNLNIPYLFHFHTNYTDGELTLKDVFGHAKKTGRALYFLEHYKIPATYDVRDYIYEVEKEAQINNVKYKIGFEISITSNMVTVVHTLLQTISDIYNMPVVGFANHSIPTNHTAYVFENLCYFYKHALKHFMVPVLVHPWRFYNNDTKKEIEKMVTLAKENEFYIESNFNILSGYKKFIFGIDAHKKADLV